MAMVAMGICGSEEDRIRALDELPSADEFIMFGQTLETHDQSSVMAMHGSLIIPPGNHTSLATTPPWQPHLLGNHASLASAPPWHPHLLGNHASLATSRTASPPSSTTTATIMPPPLGVRVRVSVSVKG
jgi:hypothetical protein